MLKRTALHELHHARGAKLAPFAGFDLPLYYPLGALKEHQLCREAAAPVAGNDAVKHRYPRTLTVQGRADRVIGHSTRSATTGGKTARRCCITT